MKNIRLVHILILTEVIFIIYFLVAIFTPHSSFIYLKQKYIIDNNLEENNISNKMYNLYIMDLYDTINEEAENKLQELKDKSITISYLDNSLDIKLDGYLKVNDILVNNISKNKFDFKLNYLSDIRENYTVDLDTTLNEEEIIEYALTYFQEFNEDMVAPTVTFIDGHLTIKNDGKKGKSLNEEDFKSRLNSSLKDYYTSESLDVVKALYDDIEIYPKKEDIEAINTKVATFTTYYGSSSYSRKTNIAVATKNINGVLLSPGEILSVDKGIKSRNAANGYLPAGSYLNGKTVQTYGGGICQVSTTLYGAVLRAGLVPVERNAHSMAISYAPLGLDAAISEGFKDLKIENTYDSPIYIEGIANGSAVTFNIYGREDLLDGYSYKPVSSSSKNGLYANSWLNKYKDGELVEKIPLFESNYRPHG